MSTIGDISYQTKWILSKRYIQAIIVIGLMTLAIAVPFFTRAFALTDVGNAGAFELDGNIYHNSGATSTTLPEDWGGCTGNVSCATGRGLFDANGNTNPLPLGGLDAHWVNDGPHATTDLTTFTTGSKDTLDIANAGWQCAPSGNLTPKDDILHSYSFAIIPQSGPRTGDLLVYAGFERFANNGAADLGLWLLQDSTVGCSSTKGAVSFTGAHVVGDILVVGEFSTGGSVTTLKEYQWVGISKAVPSGLMNITATGAVDCTIASATANICARSNTGSISTLPWSTQDKTSAANTLATAEFFEVGIDLTGLLGSNPPCINRFLFDTRTSFSLDATLKDYAEGALTTCATASISTNVSPSTIALGGSAIDTATVTLNPSGSTVNGNVTFNVYGPFSSPPTSASCTLNTLVTPFSPNTVAIGPGVSPQSATSGTFTPSDPGYYAWTATYNPVGPRNGNTNSTSCGDTGETLLVVGAHITTSVSPSPITVGGSATDTATVTLTPSTATVFGTVDFTVYGPFASSTPTCTTVATTFSGIAISGPGTGAMASATFTPSVAGYYFWIATYHPAGAANGNTVSTTCGDTGETLLFVTASITTSVSPSTITFGGSAIDTATVTLLPPGQMVSGTVDFKVYGPVATNTPTCSNLAQSFLGVVIGPGLSPQSATSSAFTPSSPGYYFWIATYHPAGAANGNTVSTTCGDTGETLLVSSIPKITAFGFTNTPTSGDPTLGSGTITYSFTIHNYGSSAVTLSGSLIVSGTASTTCGVLTPSLSGSLAAGADATFNMSCTYSGTSGQTVQATITAMYTDLNSVTASVSGSPTTYIFTIQTHI